VTHHRPNCRLSRLPLGNNNYFYSLPLYTLITILTCHNPCSGQAKPNKKAKITKPTEAPKVVEMEQQVSALGASEKQPEEPAPGVPPEIPDLSIDHTNTDSLITEPSSSPKPSETHTDDVLITGSGFIEPGNPTILEKHSAKQEVIERRKVRFDVSHYAQLSSSEILSGYLNQVHSSHDLEIEMVKQMHQKHEV
jgi:hypothetical protein